MVAGGTTVLPFGAFFGRSRATRYVGGFALARLKPTVPEREVVRHTHEEAHFVLVTHGAYLSTALGAPSVCGPPTLVYNPPGTTHRDRFLSDAGLFMTISVARTTLREVREAASIPDHALFLGPEVVGSASRLCSLAWERGGGARRRVALPRAPRPGREDRRPAPAPAPALAGARARAPA
jgi:AraC family transcriptional regulator